MIWHLSLPRPTLSAEDQDREFIRCGGRGLTANLDGMSTNMVPVIESLSFWRIEDVPFETCVAALDGWLRAGRDGGLRFGGSQLLGPMEHDHNVGTRRIQVRLARGPWYPMLRMRLDIDRWSSSSTALELIPGRLVQPTADYFRAGRLLLESLTHSVRQYREPWVTPSAAAAAV